ncbi:hypothetical protein Tco_1575308 [Tanacetum coccineum]
MSTFYQVHPMLRLELANEPLAQLVGHLGWDKLRKFSSDDHRRQFSVKGWMSLVLGSTLSLVTSVSFSVKDSFSSKRGGGIGGTVKVFLSLMRLHLLNSKLRDEEVEDDGGAFQEHSLLNR